MAAAFKKSKSWTVFWLKFRIYKKVAPRKKYIARKRRWLPKSEHIFRIFTLRPINKALLLWNCYLSCLTENVKVSIQILLGVCHTKNIWNLLYIVQEQLTSNKWLVERMLENPLNLFTITFKVSARPNAWWMFVHWMHANYIPSEQTPYQFAKPHTEDALPTSTPLSTMPEYAAVTANTYYTCPSIALTIEWLLVCLLPLLRSVQ